MRVLAVFVALVWLPLAAHADELNVVGAEKIATIDPDSGYVGDAFAFDGPGRRLVWLHLGVQPSAAKIHDLVQLAPIRSLELPDAAWTQLSFALDGEHVFAVERGAQAKGLLVG